MYLFYVSYFCVFNMSIFLSCKTNLCSWSELTGCFPTSHNIHVFKLICIKKKSMSQVVQLGIILWVFFFIYGGYHNICEFQHFCSKYFLYPFHILDTPENRKKNNVYFVLLLVWASWYFGGISTVYYLSIGADHVTPTMTTVMVASSWIMHYFIKLNSSQTGFLNITVSSWYSNSVHSHQMSTQWGTFGM